ncbi:MAG: hypothetical protein J6562_05315 [Candidatus Schmidhempelia sp.]|nr:hypothetical protein [Candidatus Schmidhempelia sp.]
MNNKMVYRQSGSVTIEFLCAALLLSIIIIVFVRFQQQIILRLIQQTYTIEAERLVFQLLDNYPINIAYDDQLWSCMTQTLNRHDDCSLIEINCQFRYGQPHHQQRWICLH